MVISYMYLCMVISYMYLCMVISYMYLCMVISFMYVCMVVTYSKSMDQLGKVADPARGQLNRENEYFPVLVCA